MSKRPSTLSSFSVSEIELPMVAYLLGQVRPRFEALERSVQFTEKGDESVQFSFALSAYRFMILELLAQEMSVDVEKLPFMINNEERDILARDMAMREVLNEIKGRPTDIA